MIAFTLWIALAVLVAYLVGQAAHLGAMVPQSTCTQNCRQGRDCTCGRSATSGETPP